MALKNWSLASCPFKQLVDGTSDLWTQSSVTTEYYYTGGDLTEKPNAVVEDGTAMTEGTLGSLAAGEWAWGDNDSIGQNVPYVRITGDADPDSKAADYIQCSEPILLMQNQEGEDNYKKIFLLTLLVSNMSETENAKIWNYYTDGSDNLIFKWPSNLNAGADPFSLDGYLELNYEEKLKIMSSIEDVSVFAMGEEGTSDNAIPIPYFHPSIDGGYNSTLCLKSDGTIVGEGNSFYNVISDTSAWSNIVAVATGDNSSYGLDANNTVFAGGQDSDGQVTDMDGLTDIIQISGGSYHAAALKSDGTVIGGGSDAEGQTSGITGWTDIVMIACGGEFTVGLKSDGSVLACGSDNEGQVSGVTGWTDIVMIACGFEHTLGVKSDGTVVGCGRDGYNEDQLAVDTWTDIVMVAGGIRHTIGLKSDGTIVGTGADNYGEVSTPTGWTDVILIACGDDHTIGLHSDGTVSAAGSDNHSETSGIDGLTDIKTDKLSQFL